MNSIDFFARSEPPRGLPIRRTIDRLQSHLGQLGRAALNIDNCRREVARSYLFLLLGALTPIVAAEHDDILYCISASDHGLGRNLFSRANFDADILERAVSLLQEIRGTGAIRGRTVIDIGANIGSTTLPVITRYGASNVLAFEPAPSTFAILQCNIILNHLTSRVQTFCIALSDTNGPGWLELSTDDSGDNRVRVGQPSGCNLFRESSRDVAPARLSRLDDVLLEQRLDLSSVGLVWIDAQGHEAQILDGAPSLLESDVPVVVEYWPYGLRRSNGLARFHEIVVSHYDIAINLRTPKADQVGLATPETLLNKLELELPDPSFTDLLLLKRERNCQ